MSPSRLIQREPLPVTSAELLLLAELKANAAPAFSSEAPLLTTSRLEAPLFPKYKVLTICHVAVGLSSRTSFDLAVVLKPIWPLTELVSRALSPRTSSVNEPFVPTVTSPVKEFVTLLNVLVAPSATSCASAQPHQATSSAMHAHCVKRTRRESRR